MRSPERRSPERINQGFVEALAPGRFDRRTRGFTLFEVLGAVALLAIVYTTLSEVAIRGLQTEGRSRRIMEASLHADLKVAEIEMELDQGVMRPLGEEPTETDDGLYRILVEVSVFEMPEIENTERPTGNSAPGQSGATGPAIPFGTGGQSPLREITVRVAWGDPDVEEYVERVTYGIDQSAIQVAESAR